MAQTYTTIQGETWDNIALKVYGEERHADFLMQSNFEHLDILVFSAGTVLNTPALPRATIHTTSKGGGHEHTEKSGGKYYLYPEGRQGEADGVHDGGV